ncbi:MAG: DUF6505 family protein [Rhodobacter sp.]|jgi:hypothetical protein|nr:DUF6505 family protein [Rhodobacter sp.]
MTQFARVIRLDESDTKVFETAAEIGEWAISGAFAFSDWTEADLQGKSRQAFANGWLGLESFGRSTFVAVAPITPREIETLTQALAQHFADAYGAPSPEAALPVAAQEIRQMQDMCEDHVPNTLMVVERSLEDVGIREKFRVIRPRDAGLEAFAVHGS